MRYYETVLVNDKRIGRQIAELVIMRDSLCEEFNLTKREICDTIEYLDVN